MRHPVVQHLHRPAKRAAAAEAAAAQKAEEERQRKEQAELQVKIKAQHAAHQERIKRHREAQAKIDEHNALVNAYLERLSVQQKKLKALRKKQRDVIELQEKVDACKKADKSFKVSKEQQQKLDRLDAIEEEIEEVSEVEKEVLATCPGELLPNAVLEADPEPLIVPTPTVQKAVPPQLQGNVAGLVISANGMGYIVTPLFGLFVYEYVNPHLPFVLCALMLLAMEAAKSTAGKDWSAKVMDVANAPGEPVYPGELGKALELIAAGTDIDYVGATAVELVGSGESAGAFREYSVKDGAFTTDKFR